jgi:hypothetical protein
VKLAEELGGKRRNSSEMSISKALANRSNVGIVEMTMPRSNREICGGFMDVREASLC